MKYTIQNSILEAVKQNLPEAVGQELKVELTRLYEVETQTALFEQDLNSSKEQLSQLKKELDTLKTKLGTLKERNDKLEEEAEEVRLAQSKINETVLQAKLECANNSNGNLMNLVQIVFRSPIGKRMICDQASGFTDSSGRYKPPQQVIKTETFTEEPSL